MQTYEPEADEQNAGFRFKEQGLFFLPKLGYLLWSAS
jgi:hypothetical protein